MICYSTLRLVTIVKSVHMLLQVEKALASTTLLSREQTLSLRHVVGEVYLSLGYGLRKAGTRSSLVSDSAIIYSLLPSRVVVVHV